MAHEFLGTFNKAMFDRYVGFTRSQLPLLDARILHLQAESFRMGLVVFRYDRGVPIGYAANPPESYLGRLLAAYEVLGGNPFVDLRVRLSTDPVFLLPGDETIDATTMSNGEVLAGKGLADAPSAILVQELKSSFMDTVYRRFDHLERKIRRAMDYVDQLQTEIQILSLLKQVATEVDGSFENLVGQIEQLISDPTYKAITPDASENAKLGQNIYAPYSSYDVPEGGEPNVVVKREVTITQRQRGDKPPVEPGEDSI